MRKKSGREEVKHNIRLRIAELRSDRGLSRAELAEKVGVSAMTIGRWENRSNSPDLADIERMADAFEVSVLELFADYPSPARCTNTMPDLVAA